MSTRSNSSHLFSPLRDLESLIRRRNLGEPSSFFDFNEVMNNNHNQEPPPQNGPPPMVRPNGQAPRTIDELCQPSINGRGRPIPPIPIQATDFGLRHHMIQQVQNTCQFQRLPGDDANRHIDKFLEITQHMKQNGVSNDALRLSLFPYSLTHHAIAWYDRLPKNSIHSFDDMMRKFISKYFPPSMATKLRNEITKFKQKPHESLFKAWEHYKLSIDQSIRDETSRNISSTSTTESPEVVRQLEMMNKFFSEMIRQFQTVKAVDTKSETCGGPHSFTECPTVGGYTQDTAYATTGTGSLPSNLVPNPREDHKVITTRSGVTLAGPSISLPLPSKEVDRELETITDQVLIGSTNNVPPLVVQPSLASTSFSTSSYSKMPEVTKDTIQPTTTPVNENCSTVILKLPEKLGDPDKFLISCDFPEFDECLALANLGASINLMPISIWKKLSLPKLTSMQLILELANRSTTRPAGIVEDVFVKVGKFHFPTNFVVVDYVVDPRVPLIFRRPFLRTERDLIDVYGEELTLRVDDKTITFKVGQTSKYSYDDVESINRIDVIDIACEEYVQEVLGFSDNSKSGNLTPSSDPIIALSSLSLTPFEGGDFILEEIKACLTSESIPPGIDDTDLDLEGDIHLLEELLNKDPTLSPLSLKELNFEEIKTVKSSIDEPSELELKELPSHLEYAFLERTDKLPVIISKELKDEEKSALLKVLKSHKQAIAWKISDIKGIDPRFCTHKFLMEDDFKPAVQHQRRVNLKVHEVIKKEVIKLLDAGLIYPIFDSPWVSPVHCVPKKGGMTVVENEDNELIPTRCMMAIFHDMIEKTMEVFMDDFLVFGDSFSSWLSHSDKMLQRCEDTNLVLIGRSATLWFRRALSSAKKFPGLRSTELAKLPHPTSPMTHLLEKETLFKFFEECIESFNTLKKKLIEAPILVAPYWDLPFEIMCDASDYAVGAVLEQRKTKHFQPIHYASKTMMDAQAHYTTTEKELLAIVYDFKKFQPYLVLSKTIVYTDHSALKYLLAKQDAKSRLLRWILLLQEFDVIIRDRKGAENLAADHLSRLENPYQDELEKKEITETFPLETLGMIAFRGDSSTSWIAPDLEASRARGFVHRPLELQYFAYENPMS
nr:reverse transcriptase domain-containing protein [Tanacetum cinerariifolium]